MIKKILTKNVILTKKKNIKFGILSLEICNWRKANAKLA